MSLSFNTTHEYHVDCMNLMHWDDMLVLETNDNDWLHIHGVKIGDLLQLFRNTFVSKYPDLTNLEAFERSNLKELKSYFEKLDV